MYEMIRDVKIKSEKSEQSLLGLSSCHSVILYLIL